MSGDGPQGELPADIVTDDANFPVEIEHLHEQRALRVKWADDHEALYPLFYVRGHCGCAECQGHFEPRKFIARPGVTLEHIEQVGNYAIGLHWSDGHNTGIYPFDRLRALCPCPECKPNGLPDEEVEPTS